MNALELKDISKEEKSSEMPVGDRVPAEQK